MSLSARPFSETFSDTATGISNQDSIPVSFQTAKRFIELQYQRVFGASIECSFEKLMVVSSHDNQLLSVAGIRTPDRPFFLEHYLEKSAEESVSAIFHSDIAREHLVEIGNLAGGRDYLATAVLMHELWQYLINSNYQYLLMTGTRTLLHRFRHLPLHALIAAKPHDVPTPELWGTYYKHAPTVVSGKLADYDFRFMKPSVSNRYQVNLLVKSQECAR